MSGPGRASGECILRSGLERYGNRQTSLPKTRILRRLHMIEGTTYYNVHSHGAPLWRNIGSRDSLHVDVMASLLPIQLSRIPSWERLALSVHLPRACRISCFSHEILNMKSYQHHHWLHGWYSGSLCIQVVSMHRHSVDVYFRQPPNAHNRLSTRPLSAISDLTQPMKLMRKCIPPKCCTIIVESIRLNPGYVDSNYLCSCWSSVNTVMSCPPAY